MYFVIIFCNFAFRIYKLESTNFFELYNLGRSAVKLIFSTLFNINLNYFLNNPYSLKCV